MVEKLGHLFFVVMFSLVVMCGFFFNEIVVAAQGVTIAGTIAKIQEARDTITALDAYVFDKRRDRKRLTGKFDKAIAELKNVKYYKALKVLENDIMDTLYR